MAPVSVDDRFGYIDQNGKTVIPFSFDMAYSFHSSLAQVTIKGKTAYIDVRGKVVGPVGSAAGVFPR
jgi:hypothetical protein